MDPLGDCFASSLRGINTIRKWDIYWIYVMFLCYIQQNSPSISAFFPPRPTALDDKLPRFRDYAGEYSLQTQRISITYTYIFEIHTKLKSKKLNTTHHPPAK